MRINGVSKINWILLYLKEVVDIYNGEFSDVVEYWDSIWDEMKWQGYNPESYDSVLRYAACELS